MERKTFRLNKLTRLNRKYLGSWGGLNSLDPLTFISFFLRDLWMVHKLRKSENIDAKLMWFGGRISTFTENNKSSVR